MVIVGLLLYFQTADQVKDTFSRALAGSNGKLLYSVFSAKELNGASEKACTSFLALVTKPRIGKIGTYDQNRKFLSILDPKSPMTVRFRDTGGAMIVIDDPRKFIFEPAMAAGGKKVGTGFADLAFWVAHEDARKAAKSTLDRAVYSHKLVESWVPKFKALGIKGSIEPETKKYMSWSEIIATSAKEIERMKKGRG